MFALNNLSDLQGVSKTEIPIFSSTISLEHTDGKPKWTPIYQSSMTGSAVAAVSIAMTILYENEGKNGRRFSRLTI